jgi:hypothetical protein
MKSLLSILFASAISTQIASAGEPVIPSELDLPSNGHCSSADDAIQFSAFRYQGGAAPPPGLLVGKKTMIVNGLEWGSVEDVEGMEIKESWPLQVELTNTTVVLSEGGPLAGRVIFTALMTVSHMTADVAPETRYVICENSWTFGAP